MNQSPIELIQLNLYRFTKNERIIAEYVLEDPQRVIQYSVDIIAQETKTSKAAFFRFCQKIGFNGYVEFRFALSRSLVADVNYSTPEDPIQKITQAYASYITQVGQMVAHSSLKKISSAIINSRRFKIFGFNRTALSAQQLRMRIGKIGLDAEVVDESITMRDVSSYMGPEDLVLIFSIKALSITYGEIISLLQANKIPYVLITMTPNNPFGEQAFEMVSLPYISKSSSSSFLDDQVMFFVFIELLMNELAREL
jgi:DNA-binding MurR/RpiR family transcriptional regulator